MSTRLKQFGIPGFIFVLLLAALPAQDKKKPVQKAPSLAQLARDARAKQTSLATPARTITNADLGGLKAKLSQGNFPEAAAAEAGGTVDPGAEVAADETPADDPFTVNDAFVEAPPGESLDESELTAAEMAVWQDAFREARMNYQNAVNEALVLQLRVNNLESAFFAQSDGAAQERLEFDLNQALKAIGENKQSQEEARAALDALQSNAAVAGMNPQQIEQLVGKLPGTPPEIEIRQPDPDPNEPPR